MVGESGIIGEEDMDETELQEVLPAWEKVGEMGEEALVED